ncbi:MAG: RNA polymerase sigma factor (sigma-70 family) [Planctomycetota bacterium]|jgi:RNA polymerase sigma factor (sigma-70 family)
MSELGKNQGNANRNHPTTEFHVNRVRAGDPSAFAQLYERLAPSLDAWSQLRVTGSLRDYIEPSDIIQEVWWRAMDAFDRYDSAKSGFRPWIFTIATNVLLEWNRKRRRKIRIEPKSLADRTASLPPALAKQATSVGRGLSLNESVKKLVSIVALLDEEDRAVFVHCGLEGLTAAEVAMLVGTNADSVNKRWQRLREKLGAHPIWHEFDPSEN